MTCETSPCRSPIVFIVFNRPGHTESVFRRIAQVRPPLLLIVADGPRPERGTEFEQCARVREIVKQVDWDCNVLTNFSETNLGCRRRIVTGLNWAFEQVEEAIILEDDIVPDISFFRFCDEMLEKYRNDCRISMVTGFNIAEERCSFPWSYFFSRLTHIWGWATWRRSWSLYDEHLSRWPEIRDAGLIREIFVRPDQQLFWTDIFDRMHKGIGPDTWDHQWAYTNLVNSKLAVTPRWNLIDNIGFGTGATHTVHAEDAPAVKAGSMSFPLHHPPTVVPLRSVDEFDGRLSGNFIPGIYTRLVRKLRRTVSMWVR